MSTTPSIELNLAIERLIPPDLRGRRGSRRDPARLHPHEFNPSAAPPGRRAFPVTVDDLTAGAQGIGEGGDPSDPGDKR